MKLYVVRHGETFENASDRLQGRIDSELTLEGIKQAQVVSNIFKEKTIDLIVSSPLKRCVETPKIISDGKIKVIYDERLLGRDHGEFTGLKKNEVNFDDYWNYYKNIKYEKAENVVVLYNRVAKLIEDLKKEYKDKNIIIVTHSGVIRVMYYYFNGIPRDGLLGEITIKNCSVFEYDL